MQEHNRIQYQLLYPKFALTGRMIFPGEAFARDALHPGDEVFGPATIEGADSAVWLPAGSQSFVDPDGNIIVNLV